MVRRARRLHQQRHRSGTIARAKAGRRAAGAKAGRRAARAKAGRRAARAKAGRRAARAKNRPFWPVGDKTGDSSHKPDRKADITRDSSAFSREAGPKTASQPPQPADNRTFWPRPDKTCDYPQPLRSEAAFSRRMKAQQGDGVAARRRSDSLFPPQRATAAGLLNQQRLRHFGTLRGRSAMCPDSPKRQLRGAFKSIPGASSGRLGGVASCVRPSDA